MEESQTWRELLAKIINDPQERQWIADAIGVNPVTLVRWATYKSNPRPENVRPLLRALPQNNQLFSESLQKEFPHVFHEGAAAEEIVQEVASAFYSRVLNAYTSVSPILRTSAICLLVLQQILDHLDPYQFGMRVVLVQCVPPPRTRNMVRSLRAIVGRGTPPWKHLIEHQLHFLGAESQAGYAVFSGHPSVVQDREAKMQLFPAHCILQEESTASYPLLLSGKTAGCLCLSSTQKKFFSQVRLDLIHNYVNLLVLAFKQEDFYELQQIQLGIIPPLDLQQPHIARFQPRVTQLMLQTAGQAEPLTLSQAELIAWQEVEEALLQQAPEQDQIE